MDQTGSKRPLPESQHPSKKSRPEEIKAVPVSIFNNYKPTPDLLIHIQKFLQHTLATNAQQIESLKANPHIIDVHFEIEAKLGIIVDKRTSNRVHLPCHSETVLLPGDYRFESNMSMEQHSKYNQLLNSLAPKVQYRHTKLLDEFYHSDLGKVRKTSKDGVVQDFILKKRLADLELAFPSHPLDCRISVSLECNLAKEMSIRERVGAGRAKDRLSYYQMPFTVDLTQVKSDSVTTHELEIEIDNDWIKHIDGPRGIELIASFLNNIRVLARKKY
jgi:hypothetical protein